MTDITILTESRYLDQFTADPYSQNIILEDRLIGEALKKHGLSVQRKDWADPEVDWSETNASLFRTTWDYFDKFDQFKTWLETTSQQTTFINPIEIIMWNMDKHYLKDLKDKGINIPPTHFIKKGEQKSLIELVNDSGWNELVLKPTIAGTARHTYKLDPSNIENHQQIFSQLIAKEDMMIQKFMNNIVEKGEVSLILIGGVFSHAVLKKAKPGDFRVQDDFGGTLHDYQPSFEEIQFAEKAVSACSPQPHYARVDMIWDNEGIPAIGELELIEPELWFRRYPVAADALASEIIKHYF